jgi:protein farnesyltransferase/geranylgeranyltransferase type-1 subunit alpha
MNSILSMQCIKELKSDMNEEWKICLVISKDNSKNYQLWNHRRLLAMDMGRENAKRELEFASSVLEEDAKNYHIWAHRQVRRAL